MILNQEHWSLARSSQSPLIWIDAYLDKTVVRNKMLSAILLITGTRRFLEKLLLVNLIN